MHTLCSVEDLHTLKTALSYHRNFAVRTCSPQGFDGHLGVEVRHDVELGMATCWRARTLDQTC
eukprot:6186545-Alexandrium_andersonii.AAC.1